MQLEQCELRVLTPDFELPYFDFGDEDLNDFLQNDAKAYVAARLAKIYLAYFESQLVAYWAVSNDSISTKEQSNSEFKKVQENFPASKQIRSYPALKIGRLPVNGKYRSVGLGSQILSLIIAQIDVSFSGCVFITVDAYLSKEAQRFYEKNEFHFLTQKDSGTEAKTRSMYKRLPAPIFI